MVRQAGKEAKESQQGATGGLRADEDLSVWCGGSCVQMTRRRPNMPRCPSRRSTPCCRPIRLPRPSSRQPYPQPQPQHARRDHGPRATLMMAYALLLTEKEGSAGCRACSKRPAISWRASAALVRALACRPDPCCQRRVGEQVGGRGRDRWRQARPRSQEGETR